VAKEKIKVGGGTEQDDEMTGDDHDERIHFQGVAGQCTVRMGGQWNCGQNRCGSEDYANGFSVCVWKRPCPRRGKYRWISIVIIHRGDSVRGKTNRLKNARFFERIRQYGFFDSRKDQLDLVGICGLCQAGEDVSGGSKARSQIRTEDIYSACLCSLA
jgi:hypothetical protein